jgi:hypothetical protein
VDASPVGANPPAGRAEHRWVWLLDLAVALGVSTIAALFVWGWLADNACLDAGGRALRAGADRLCEFSGGRVEPLSVHLSAAGFAVAAGSWLMLTLTLYWSGRRFIRRGRT